MLSESRLIARKMGVGGNDAGAVLGMCPYATALNVYDNKVGIAPDKDLSGVEAVHFGNVLEDVVATEFARRTNLTVRRDNRHIKHKTAPLLANIDRAIVGRPGGMKAGLECKTVGTYAAKPELWGEGASWHWEGDEFVIDEYDDKVPDWYLMQCVHYMSCTNADIWFLAALIGGNNFRVYTIKRDMDLEQIMLDRLTAFWNDNVLARVPPQPTTLGDLDSLYRDRGTSTTAPHDIIENVKIIKGIKKEIARLDAMVKGEKRGGDRVGGLEMEVKEIMGNNSQLTDFDGQTIATWRQAKPVTRLDAARLKKEKPDIYAEYCKTSTAARRFLIK